MREPAASSPAELADALRAELSASGHLEDAKWRAFCDDACLQRYLRARGNDVGKAAAMLRATLEWRQQQRIDEMRAAEFVHLPFMKDGYVYVGGHDAAGRTVMVFRKRKTPFPMHLQADYLRFMTYMLEVAVANMKPGQEQWVWVLDLSVFAPNNSPHPSIALGVLKMLADHFPERLHRAYIVNAPSIFQVFWKMLAPFVDPKSRSKVEFVSSADYGPGKPASKASWWSASRLGSGGGSGSSSSSWGSWASSMWGGGKSDAEARAEAELHAAAEAAGVDADVVVADGPEAAKAGTEGPGTFGPYLRFYDTPHCFDAHQALLAGLGR